MKKSIIYSTIISALFLTACNDSKHTDVTTNLQTANKHAANSTENTDNTQTKNKVTLAELYQQATKALFSQRELSASVYGLPVEDVGIYYADKMEDYSPANEAKLRQSLLDINKEIAKTPLSNNTATAKTTKEVMLSLTRYFAGNPNFSIGYIDTWMGLSPFIINQINGPLISIVRNMQTDQKITNEKDAQDYLARLSQFDQLIDSIAAKVTSDATQNWLPPKIILQGALRYLHGFTKPEPSKHTLVTSFAKRVNKITELSDQKKQQLIARATDKVANIVYPAYKKITQVTEQLLPKARTEAGIWAQPNGEKFYQDAIHELGDSDLTAEEIHQLGLSEVARINKQMDTILKAQGYTKGSVGERMVALNEEPRFLYADSAAGRAKLLKDVNGYIAQITAKMPIAFKATPKYKVEVRPYPIEIQDGAPGGEYNSPSIDGSKPGIYWINLRDMKANPKFGLKTLTYHEAIPGHHWQIALNLEQADMPFLRRIAPYNAYAEGWALYSERVAAEMGMYKNDPFGDLGRLQGEMFRAVRLVVDTGLHYKRWTREKAIDYMAAQTGSAKSDVIAEIERYMTWPGQALGYKLGMLKILSLRKHAKEMLGDKFDLGEFHDVVLLGGAVPMKVLEENINQWIASKNT
jgi:uncharacterized protein (DUF885 family)